MNNLEIYDNAGLILENVSAIGTLVSSIDKETTEAKCSASGMYCIAIFAMLDKISEYVGKIQDQTKGDFK